MDAPTQEPLPESRVPVIIPTAGPPPPVSPEYRGNQYDVFSLLAGTLGGVTLLMCVSGGMAYYCLPIVPLVLGILALRQAKTAVDPQRTRNLAWIGIAGGGIGMLLLLCMLAFLMIYMVFIFSMIGAGISSSGR